MIGIYGGTFDPPHLGHYSMMTQALEALPISRLHLIPAAVPAHRPQPMASAAHRLAMVQLLAETDDRLLADDCELKRDKPSYTVDTLRSFRAQYPDEQLVFFLGQDSFVSLPTWDEWEILASLCCFAVFPREGSDQPGGELLNVVGEAADIKAKAVGWQWLDVAPFDISATEIRRQLRGGLRSAEDLDDYLHPSTQRYIVENNLYAPSRS